MKEEDLDDMEEEMDILDEVASFLKDKWTRIHTISQLRRKYDFN